MLLIVPSRYFCTQILSPSSLLTQKFDPVVEPLLDFDPKNMYKAQWQRVQTLADMFWSRWQHDYLQTLQRRHKWQSPESNLKSGDVVLLQDDETSRGEWPMAIVVNAIKSEDGKVRKGTSRQRSGKGAIRKRLPLQKPRWEKTKLTIRHLYHETYRKPNEQLFSQ